MAKGRKSKPEAFDFSKLVSPGSDELKQALGSLLRDSPPAEPLRITGLRTRSQHGAASVFKRKEDALILVIDIAASEDLVTSGTLFDANFQIIDRATNAVEKDIWSRDLHFAWGPNFWISVGSDGSGDSSCCTTPSNWKLGRGLFAFRAALELPAAGEFCRSEEILFRVS